jgi:putative transcriptional regulator
MTRLVFIFMMLLLNVSAICGAESGQMSVANGVFLVASPTLNDPNFSQTVVLVVEHGSKGTLGVILNRPTNMLLSEALPEVRALKGTSHRLFAGGPVQPRAMMLLSRSKEPYPDMRSVFDHVYVGGTPEVLERMISRAAPADRFRAFAGYAGWAPGQLGAEMREGAWAVLSPDNEMFDKDPAAMWPESVARLQAPRVISN